MNLLLMNPETPDGHVVRIDRFPFTVGRSNPADGLIPLAFISRKHCRFRLHGEEVLVEDLGSANGTYVNGVRVTAPTPVRAGDQLRLGPLGFRVALQGAVHERPPRRALRTHALVGGRPVGEPGLGSEG